MKSIMFRDESKREAIRDWSLRFRQKVTVPVESVSVDTVFGSTHILTTGPVDTGMPPLVVLHGALASSAHVLPELGSLVTSRRIIAIDVVGQSVWSEDRRLDLRDDSYGRWFHETCDRLNLGDVDLYGISWGGFVSLKAAAYSSSRIKHLALLVPAGLVANTFWAGLRDAGFALMMYQMFPSKERLSHVMEAVFTDADADWTAYFAAALANYRLDMRAPPLFGTGELSTIDCPILVVGAEHDASFPGRAMLTRAREIWPKCDVELLEGSKHCPPMDPPFREKMAKRLVGFFSR